MAPSDEGGEPYSVPADPKARYFVVSRTGTPQRPILITRRAGSSGTSYAKREFDCKKRTAKYLSEGDTLAELDTPSQNSRMGPLVEGSSTHAAWEMACKM